MYLSLVTDAYSKKIVGFNLSNTLQTTQSIKALKQAINNREYSAQPLIHHSDRGLQYCSDSYQKLFHKNSIQCSMTEQYDPYQNVIEERVNGILKQEFLNNKTKISINLMRTLVKQSNKICNTKRPHLSCEMLTPEQMHKQNKVRIETYKRKISD